MGMEFRRVLFRSIDIGGTTVSLAIIEDSGSLIHKAQMETLWKQGAQDVIERICATLDLLLDRSGQMDQISHIGVGCAGMIDRASGMVVYSHILNGIMYLWEKFSEIVIKSLFTWKTTPFAPHWESLIREPANSLIPC